MEFLNWQNGMDKPRKIPLDPLGKCRGSCRAVQGQGRSDGSKRRVVHNWPIWNNPPTLMPHPHSWSSSETHSWYNPDRVLIELL
eukprot:354957-Chlamydomonas_euryale.AAC.2